MRKSTRHLAGTRRTSSSPNFLIPLALYIFLTANLLPNLRVDSKALQTSWIIDYEYFADDDCQVLESNGALPNGTNLVVRFDVSTPNAGPGDVNLGDPTGQCLVNSGMYDNAENCHHHPHFNHYATYVLRNANGLVLQSVKRGFCMVDCEPNSAGTRAPFKYDSCETNQGISAGFADVYDRFLPSQLFNLNGLNAGKYMIEINVNPRYCRVQDVAACGNDAACRALPLCSNGPSIAGCDATQTCCEGQRGIEIVRGVMYCHMLVEWNYLDNVGSAAMTIPKRPFTLPYGPGVVNRIVPIAAKRKNLRTHQGG